MVPTRHGLVKLISCWSALLLVVAAHNDKEHKTKKPNFIYIITDDQYVAIHLFPRGGILFLTYLL